MATSAKVIREVTGTVKDNKLSWYAKDARGLGGVGQGGDNFGTIDGDKIDFVWSSGKETGTLTLKKEIPVMAATANHALQACG